MARFVMFCSGKGGVGKSTLTYRIGLKTAAAGAKTLLLDADVGLCNLDLVSRACGVSTYDLYDVYRGAAELDEAITHVGPGLDLLALYGSTKLGDLAAEVLTAALARLNKEYDLVLIDAPAGIEKGFELARKVTDLFMLVINPTLTSFADAVKVAAILKRDASGEIGLVFNRFSGSDLTFFRTRGGELCSYPVWGRFGELGNSFFAKRNYTRECERVAEKLLGGHERTKIGI